MQIPLIYNVPDYFLKHLTSHLDFDMLASRSFDIVMATATAIVIGNGHRIENNN